MSAEKTVPLEAVNRDIGRWQMGKRLRPGRRSVGALDLLVDEDVT
jgi:hypothetical protein